MSAGFHRKILFIGLMIICSLSVESLAKVPVEQLLNNLNDPNPTTRFRAVETLAQSNDSRAVDALINALKDEHYGVRREAVKALGKIKDPRAAAPLVQLLEDEFRIWPDAVNALGGIGESALRPLLDALADANIKNKRGVVQALGLLKDPRAGDALIDVLKNSDGELRGAAIQALSKTGDQRAISILITKFAGREAQMAAEGLAKFGGPAVEPAISALNDDRYSQKFFIIELLGKLADPRATEPLLQLLSKEVEPVSRGKIIEALCKIKDPRTTKFLANQLYDDQNNNRWGVIMALAEMKDPQAVDALIYCLRNSPPSLKDKAAYALGEIGDIKAVEPLINELNQAKEYRINMVKALGKMKDPRAVQAVINALDHDDTRPFARDALPEMGKLAVEPLILKLNSPKTDVVRSVIFALGEIGDEKAVPYLSRILKYGVPLSTVPGISMLFNILKKERAVHLMVLSFLEKTDFQIAAAVALGKIGGKQAVNVLNAALQSRKPSLHEAVFRALHQARQRKPATSQNKNISIQNKLWPREIVEGQKAPDVFEFKEINDAIKDPRECRTRGGSWMSREMPGKPRMLFCDLPTTDNGKRCSDSSQCEGYCLSPGRCSGSVYFMGCQAVVVSGLVRSICVDENR